MIRRHPRFTRTDTLFPYTTLFRSVAVVSLQKRLEFGPALYGARIAAYRTGRRAGCAAKRKSPAFAGLRLHRMVRAPGLQDAQRVFDECTRSEEHTSELQSLMRISYAVFCLKKKNV